MELLLFAFLITIITPKILRFTKKRGGHCTSAPQTTPHPCQLTWVSSLKVGFSLQREPAKHHCNGAAWPSSIKPIPPLNWN